MAQTNRTRRFARAILFVLAVLTAPVGCCGGLFLLDALPASRLPPAVNFLVNLFEVEARVENRSGETLYLTPVTTTYGRPVVIRQLRFIRQRDIPLGPNKSVVLIYDAADTPLAGIAVCRANGDCRLLEADSPGVHYLPSFASLPELEASWRAAIRSHPPYSFAIALIPIISLLPAILLAGSLYLGRLERKRAGQ